MSVTPKLVGHNYIFQLIVDGDVLDETNLSENSPDLAMDLFLGEFGWGDKLTEEQKRTAKARLWWTEEEYE